MKRRKILYIICLIGIIWMNIIYVEREIFLLLVLFTGIPAVSWIIMQLSKLGLTVQVISKDNVLQEKSVNRIKFRAVNDFFLPVFDAKLKLDMAYLNDRAENKENKTVQINVSRYYKNSRAIEIESVHCGIMQIVLNSMEIRDITGLFVNNVEYKGYCNTVIMPKLVRLNEEGTKNQEQDVEEYIYNYISVDNTEVMELKPYTPGDSVNHIHWKLSSKNEDMIVKKYGSLAEKNNIIIVDLSCDERENFRYELDKIYKAAFSIGNMFVEDNIRSSFLIWDEKKRSAEYITFDSRESLNGAMIELMSVECSKDAGIQADKAYISDAAEIEEKPVFITMKGYTNKNYQIVNVSKGKLKDVMRCLN